MAIANKSTLSYNHRNLFTVTTCYTMADMDRKSHGTQPPPSQTSATGHPLPRRTSPANSITLRHHRAAREASLRASAGSAHPGYTNTDPTDSSRRNSSGDSHVTGQSGERNGQNWFNHSNKNPTATFDTHAMDSELRPCVPFMVMVR